jgi:O-antigen/teichoic acid export membrane protein
MALMSLAFIPLYIKFLGIEAYALIGFFATLNSLFGFLDLGLSSTLNRELARSSVSEGDSQKPRNLLRTLESVYLLVALLIILIVGLSSQFIATDWLNTENLSVETVEKTVVLLGIAIGFQWPLGLYRGGLQGLQKQVLVNVINSGLATLRGVGAALILWLISPTIEAFFLWQAFISLLGTIITGMFLWHNMPKGEQRARFDTQLLRSVWKFAAGAMGAAVTWVVLSQLDKVLLSALLPLEVYGYYMLAVVVASVLGSFYGPIYTAMFPRLSQLVEMNDQKTLVHVYHRACQLTSVTTLPAAMLLAFFSSEILLLWTSDPIISNNSASLVALLVFGTAFHGIMHLPYALQLAHGWTSLRLYLNLVAIILLVPMLFVMVHYYQAIGAAIVWLALSVCYVVFDILIMHGRILKGEQWRWYFEDVGLPLVAALVAIGVAKWLCPADMSQLFLILYLAGVLFVSYIATAIITPQTRILLMQYLPFR